MSVHVSSSPSAPVTGAAASPVRDFVQRVRDGDLGVLPVVVGLLLIGGFFALRSDAFLTSISSCRWPGSPRSRSVR